VQLRSACSAAFALPLRHVTRTRPAASVEIVRQSRSFQQPKLTNDPWLALQRMTCAPVKQAWEELVARHGSNLLAEWLSRAVERGRIAPVPIQPLTRLLIAMISESSLYIARADDRPTARAAMGTVLDRLLTGLEPAR
jgi:hypothetical protein